MPKSRHPKHKPKSSQPSGSLLLNVPKELQRIDDLIADGDLERAEQDLQDLARRAPHRADVFETMLLLGMKTNDFATQLAAALRLVELQPYVAAHHYNLFVVYLRNNLPALALQAGQYFLSRWPEAKLGKDLPKLMEEVGAKLHAQPIVAQFPQERRAEILALHDRALLENSRGNYEQVIIHATQLLEQEPKFAAAYNNRALAYWFMGENEAALADTKRALDLEPNNVHALFNLVRLLRLENRIEEARAAAERLTDARSTDPEVWAKLAEALMYLSDDAAVLDLAAQAEAAEVLATEDRFAFLLSFYAGVAAARLSDETKARVFLKKALAHAMTSARARQQLAELDKPVGQRDGPCALLLDHWIPRRLVEEFMHILESGARTSNPATTKAGVQKYLSRHPNLTALVPVLLERGDRITREFAQHLARLADTPELWQVLKAFVSSPHGSDHVRNQVLMALQDAGQLAKGQVVTFWSRGRATQIKVLRYTIDDEPYEPIVSPQVSAATIEALAALNRNEPQRAEEALQRALQAEPASANLQYHLVLVYLQQGLVGQARELAEKIAAQHPSFAFPRCELALIALANDHKEEAHEHLEILSALEHFHHLEYAQFCRVQVLYQVLAESDLEAAQHWLEVWEKRMPPEPQAKAAREALKNRLTSKQWARQTLANYRE